MKQLIRYIICTLGKTQLFSTLFSVNGVALISVKKFAMRFTNIGSSLQLQYIEKYEIEELESTKISGSFG